MKNKIMAAAAVSACALAWAAKDPVLMTVGGIDVPKSEFEYLYHKNTQQQVSEQPLEEYAEMFKVYKLKVADALAAGVDTTASFRREMEQYRRDLAAPFMADSAYLLNFVQEAYDRSRREVELSHIMLMKSPDRMANAAQRQRIDSIRAILVGEGRDFEEMARAFSQDRSVAMNGGNLGFVTAGRLPYSFEVVGFSTPEGAVSEVVESPAGYHIIKGGRRRPARGQVLTQHIMKMVAPGASAAEDAAAKAWADSVCREARSNPARFEDMARALSDDKGSARQGGQLPWFGAGMMVAPFDSAAFALEVGEISEPVRSQYGWHIIRKLDAKAAPTLAELKPEVLQRLSNPQDERSGMVQKHNWARLAKKHKGSVSKAGIKKLNDWVTAAGELDSAFYDACRDGELAGVEIARIGKRPLTASQMVQGVRQLHLPAGEEALERIEGNAEAYLNRQLMETEYDWLEANEPDYRNLMREYRDGSLLYEVSVAKVWDKASRDTEGLDRFFKAHRQDYQWKKPHVKGYLVQALNDSVAEAARLRLPSLGGDTIVSTMRKEFGKNITIDRVLVEEGQNPMVDNIVFGAAPVKPAAASMTTYFLYDPKVLTLPEEVNDVRGLVTSDYQTELENLWVEELKARYPVTVDKKVLKKVK
ncbi:MAG: peptidylprolyl isomerase [Muribaculaceae bacterium]|nr:peptidylprolyl isomerase [Muribaculaceae bacterium]